MEFHEFTLNAKEMIFMRKKDKETKENKKYKKTKKNHAKISKPIMKEN